jgi:hypothetical protein
MLRQSLHRLSMREDSRHTFNRASRRGDEGNLLGMSPEKMMGLKEFLPEEESSSYYDEGEDDLEDKIINANEFGDKHAISDECSEDLSQDLGSIMFPDKTLP